MMPSVQRIVRPFYVLGVEGLLRATRLRLDAEVDDRRHVEALVDDSADGGSAATSMVPHGESVSRGDHQYTGRSEVQATTALNMR
jgi:hypothetical protein